MPKLTAKLTETQFRHFMNAQVAFQRAKAQFDDARAKLQTISTLVLDAHDLPTTGEIALNVETQTIEIETNIVPIEALAPDD